MAMASKPLPLHVVMFPWLGFGHIIPYLNLSKLLAHKGCTISFVSAPRNIDRLPKLPPHLSSSISFVKMPLPQVQDLPENIQATNDIHLPHQMDLLKKAFDGLQPAFTRFLHETHPDWIIHDFAQYWLPPIAAGLGVSTLFFVVTSPSFAAFVGPVDQTGSDYGTRPEHFMVPPKWVNFDTNVAFRRFEANWMVRASQDDASGITDFQRVGNIIQGCDAMLVRHCYEFEPNWLHLVEELYHKVVPLGLMPPMDDNFAEDSGGDTWMVINDWLNGHDDESVVYVAFGSETKPSPNQINELARGLELSSVPFFWVLPKPSEFSESSITELPSGFEERVNGRGIVWRNWAPQLRILSHKSVGGLITHGGWGSVIEALMYGHPLITLPFLCDQGLNCRIVVENQLGLEIQRNDEDGSFTSESVMRSITRVMREKEGEIMRGKAKEISKIFSDMELHGKYVDKLVKFMEDRRTILKL